MTYPYCRIPGLKRTYFIFEMFESPKLIGKVGHDVFPVGDPGHEALVLAVEPVVELTVADPWAPKVVKVVHLYP